MNGRSLRIAVGRLYHESNRLNPQTTTQDALDIVRGEAVTAESSGSTLAGIIGRLREKGATIVPILSMSGPPSGLLDHGFYQHIKVEFLERVVAARPDAVVLDLHGAMATTETADADGDFLAALREALGPGVPIGVGLDLHAHLTDAMLRNTDVCIACKENPHSDTVACGEKAVDMILEVMAGALHAQTAVARVPMILPGAGETAEGPLFEIHEKARGYADRRASIRDISIYNVFRYADDTGIGQVVTVTTNGPDPEAGVIAGELAGDFWRNRERFEDRLLSDDDAFRRVEDDPTSRPYVMADMGDRILAGAPGDSVYLLHSVLERFPGLRGGLTITDPDNAQRGIKAGLGAKVKLQVGGQLTPGFSPLEIEGEVTHLSDGAFQLAGPFHGGEESSLGPTAVILVDGRIHVVLTSKPAFSHDPAVYTSQGVAIADLDFVVVKSGYHFTMNYAGIATPLFVSTPGVGYYRKGHFPYHKGRFWPEHDIGDVTIQPVTITPRALADAEGARS